MCAFVLKIFIWIDKDPEAAFDQAALGVEIAEVVWDSSAVMLNAAVDVFNAGVIPVWNAAAFYIVEPSLMLVIEVFSMVFTGEAYTGVIDPDSYTYNGLDCTASAEAAEWCGRYSFYAQQLESAAHAEAYVNESDNYAGRRLFDPVPDRNFTFGTRTARRLATLGGSFVTPAFSIDRLTEALNDFSMLAITLGAVVGDVGAGVLFEVLSSSFSLLMDSLWQILTTLLEVLKMLVSTLQSQTRTHSDSPALWPDMTQRFKFFRRWEPSLVLLYVLASTLSKQIGLREAVSKIFRILTVVQCTWDSMSNVPKMLVWVPVPVLATVAPVHPRFERQSQMLPPLRIASELG